MKEYPIVDTVDSLKALLASVRKAQEEFDKVNEELCADAYKANAYANCLGPIVNNIGNILDGNDNGSETGEETGGETGGNGTGIEDSGEEIIDGDDPVNDDF